MKEEPNYWLIKSEGHCYPIDQLRKDKRTPWSGVRNYQARNFMRDGMRVGDLALFYHSEDKPSGVYGIAQVACAPHPDESQFDPRDEHFDPKSKKENPTWMCVDFKFVEKFKRAVSLAELKIDPKLEGMRVRQRGDRLSVHPVSKKHFEYIVELGREEQKQ